MEDTKDTPTPEVAPEEVETPSEQVAETETSDDAPVEAETDTAKESPEVTQDWETRYKELQSFATRTAQENAELRRMQERIAPPTPQEVPQLDPDSAQAVDAYIEQKLTNKKAEEFVNRHRKEILDDPILAGTTMRLVEQATARGESIDYEDAISQAKKMLDERVKPQVKEAKQTGVAEGTELARKKGELGAVGETGKQPEVDESKLSSREYAKLHGLSYME